MCRDPQQQHCRRAEQGRQAKVGQLQRAGDQHPDKQNESQNHARRSIIVATQSTLWHHSAQEAQGADTQACDQALEQQVKRPRLRQAASMERPVISLYF
jgi:hypothetical protein